MKKRLLTLTLLALTTHASAASPITEADIRAATLDNRILMTLQNDRTFLLAMIKDGLPACKQQKGTFVAVEYRKDRTVGLGCALAVTDSGKTMKEGDFLIRWNSGENSEIPTAKFARISASRVQWMLKDEFGPMGDVVKQNNDLMDRMNALEPSNTASGVTPRKRERMYDCMRMFASEIEELSKQGAPFAQNLYELRERIKTTGDKTTASILLDPPTPDTLRNFNELQQRTQPLKRLLDSVDAKYAKCEAKYLKT